MLETPIEIKDCIIMVNTWRAPDVQSTSSRRNMLKCNDVFLGENIFRDRFGGGLPFRFSARTSRTRTSVEHVGWWVNIIRRMGGLPGFGSNHSLGIFEVWFTPPGPGLWPPFFLYMYPERVQTGNKLNYIDRLIFVRSWALYTHIPIPVHGKSQTIGWYVWEFQNSIRSQ